MSNLTRCFGVFLVLDILAYIYKVMPYEARIRYIVEVSGMFIIYLYSGLGP